MDYQLKSKFSSCNKFRLFQFCFIVERRRKNDYLSIRFLFSSWNWKTQFAFSKLRSPLPQDAWLWLILLHWKFNGLRNDFFFVLVRYIIFLELFTCRRLYVYIFLLRKLKIFAKNGQQLLMWYKTGNLYNFLLKLFQNIRILTT